MSPHGPDVTAVVGAYTAHFGPPEEVLPFKSPGGLVQEAAVVVYLPEDAEASTSMLGTAGLSVVPLGKSFFAELGMEIKGSVPQTVRGDLAEALIDLASAPLKIARPFAVNQILTNVHLPLYDRFTMAILVDWDPVYGFKFPNLPRDVTLLRVVPLFESEAKYIEAAKDRY